MPEIKKRTLGDILTGKFKLIHVTVPIEDRMNNIIVVRNEKLYTLARRNETIEIRDGEIIEENGEKKIKDKNGKVVCIGDEIRIPFIEEVKNSGKQKRRKQKKIKHRGARKR